MVPSIFEKSGDHVAADNVVTLKIIGSLSLIKGSGTAVSSRMYLKWT
ncbi:hypothetical protein ACFL9T_19740 [Thermodesulfobacteriota bacterium]